MENLLAADLVRLTVLVDLGIELDVAFGDAEFLAELAVQGGVWSSPLSREPPGAASS
ncbi:hypothetical protein [Nonomuraea sp. NPDC003754]